MTRKLEIEAAVDRSLRKQVAAPRLDGRFDAAVWARIEAEEQRAPAARQTAAVASQSARWLFISNVIGGLVALVLVLYFGIQWFGSVEASVPALSVPALSVPDLSTASMVQIARVAIWSVTIASLAFGFMFTSLARRLRSEFL